MERRSPTNSPVIVDLNLNFDVHIDGDGDLDVAIRALTLTLPPTFFCCTAARFAVVIQRGVVARFRHFGWSTRIFARESTTSPNGDEPGVPPCPDCGGSMLAADPGAPCRRCLLRLADASSAPPSHIGDYEVSRELGRGAMGTVYLAEQALPRKMVALKVLAEHLVDDRVLRWFADEVEILGKLEHPHIVPIYDGNGLRHTPPFFTMRWIDGSTLADPNNRERYRAPDEAARLLIKIAGAVQFAHERGVLHRDLKPSNILLDSSGQPYVSDFGLARMLNGDSVVAPDAVAGSLGFMSPEQAASGHELTVASDVYGLGAMLYDVLTGVPPRLPRDHAHLLELFEAGEATDPRELAPSVSADLARVCSCAIERDPKLRYRSAAEFADDLQRVLDRKPPEPRNLRQPSEFRKALYWARRHRIVVFLAVTLVMYLGFIPMLPNFVEKNLSDQVREQNASLAQAQAGAVISELHTRSDQIAAMARDPEVAALTRWHDVFDPPAALQPYGARFDLLCVFSTDGTLTARYPKPIISRYKTLDYSFRDYFAGQRALDYEHRGAVYISRAFLSTGDQTLQFGFSAPMFDARGARVGTVMAGVTTRSTFGAVRMDPGHGMTALLGARDRDSASQALPTTLTVLAAPGLARGVDKPVGARMSKLICDNLNCTPQRHEPLRRHPREKILSLDDYPDPISGAPSIAALAPVGETGIIVVVATQKAFVSEIKQGMADTFTSHAWIPLLGGLGLTLLIVNAQGFRDRLHALRRRRRIKRSAAS